MSVVIRRCGGSWRAQPAGGGWECCRCARSEHRQSKQGPALGRTPRGQEEQQTTPRKSRHLPNASLPVGSSFRERCGLTLSRRRLHGASAQENRKAPGNLVL